MNERYQKHTAPAGKTRKSAAAAKPKRDAGAQSKKKSPAKRSRSAFIGNPPTEEFRRLRKLWWILLGGSLIFTMGSLAIREWLQSWALYQQVAGAMLGIGYVMIGAALYIDLTKIRKMRKDWIEAGAPDEAHMKQQSKANDES